jgi:hypothetical protein
MTENMLDPSAFRTPAIALAGVVDYAMYQSFSRSDPRLGATVLDSSELGNPGALPLRPIGKRVRECV